MNKEETGSENENLTSEKDLTNDIIEVEVPDDFPDENEKNSKGTSQPLNKDGNSLKGKLVTELNSQNCRTDNKQNSRKDESNNNPDTIKIVSVSEALKLPRSIVRVKGIIVSKTKIYNFWREKPEVYDYSYSVHSSRRYRPVPKEDHCAIDLEIADTQNRNYTQYLKAILEDDLVNHIKFGRFVIITGEIGFTRVSRTKSKPIYVNQLTATNLDYSAREKRKLPEDRVAQIKELAKKDPAVWIKSLLSIFEPNITGLDSVKLALLISLVNADCKSNTKGFDNRCHVLLTGYEKVMTILLKSVANLCNGLYINLTTNSIPITVQVTKEEDGKKKLNSGQVVLARDEVLALDRIEQLKKNDIGYLEEVIKEGQLNVNTEDFKEIIPAHTTLIASINGHDDSLYPKGMQITKRFQDLISNFDFICKCDSADVNTAEVFNTNHNSTTEDKLQLLKHHVFYATTINPEIDDKAMRRISDYCIAQTELTSTNRIKVHDTLLKTTIAIARVKLKEIAAEQESIEAIEFIESSKVQGINMISTISLKDKIVNQCIARLQISASPIKFNRLIQLVCEDDKMIQEYLGKKLTISNNSKVRDIAQILKKNPKIQILKEKPLVLKYIL